MGGIRKFKKRSGLSRDREQFPKGGYKGMLNIKMKYCVQKLIGIHNMYSLVFLKIL